MSTRRRVLAVAASALLTPLLVVPLAGPAATAGAHPRGGSLASSIAVDWQRTAVRTIFVERGTAPPLGALYLSFTSLAVHDAASRAQRHGTRAAAAAVADGRPRRARRVLPGIRAPALDADLATSLAMVPDGRKEAAGVAIGAAAADAMIASRVGDGRDDTQHRLHQGPRPRVSGSRCRAGDGAALARLRRPGRRRRTGSARRPRPDHQQGLREGLRGGAPTRLGGLDQAECGADRVAQFFSANPVADLPERAVRPARRRAARPAGHHPAVRPDRRGRRDGVHPDVAAEVRRRLLAAVPGHRRRRCRRQPPGPGPHPTTWVPLVTNPAYSDYTSGHAAATSPFAEVLRRTFGDHTPLVLEGRWRRAHATPPSAPSSTTPSTPASGVACTSGTRWTTATTWATRRPERVMRAIQLSAPGRQVRRPRAGRSSRRPGAPPPVGRRPPGRRGRRTGAARNGRQHSPPGGHARGATSPRCRPTPARRGTPRTPGPPGWSRAPRS